ncbi:MAG: aldo/keto reductase [Firmicutes bacterium]|nr:aldo/keto reductase [Bacillota bacterium]
MTDLTLPQLGYGCYALAGAYGNCLSEQQKLSQIQLAYDLGIRFFDTAGNYGDTEITLGRAVASFRDKILVASKVGPTDDGKVRLTRKHVMASCEQSLRRLGTDYLDLLQVHFDDPDTPVAETVAALESLQAQGKIRAYGVGHLPVDRVREYVQFGSVATVLAEMNAVSRLRYQELMPLQEKWGFAIIAFSVTGRGLLTGKVTPQTRFASGDIRQLDPMFRRAKLTAGLRLADELAAIGAKFGKSPAQIAIAWVLQHSGVTTALTGPLDPNHLRENVAVADWRLPQEYFARMNKVIEQQEKLVRHQIVQEVREILVAPLAADPGQAQVDLVYVLEHALEYQWLAYDTGIEIFRAVLGEPEASALTAAQAHLRDHVRAHL